MVSKLTVFEQVMDNALTLFLLLHSAVPKILLPEFLPPS